MTASTTSSVDLDAFEASLPEVVPPLASYVPTKQVGDLVFTAGALPLKEGVVQCTGAVGSITVPIERAQEAARLCGINLLANLKAHLGTLKRVKQVVKLTGYVNSTPSFTQQALIVNGASDLMIEVFGEAGRHARTSVGVAALPMDASVEVELIVEVGP